MIYNSRDGAYETHIKKDWHKWFAWKPTEINGSTVWLKTVFRRGYRYNPRSHLVDREPGIGVWNWDYAVDLFELMSKSDEAFPLGSYLQGQSSTSTSNRPMYPITPPPPKP